MTPLQRDILTVLRINPVPLMTAEDIACAVNEWPGIQRAAGGVGASCAALGKRGLLKRKMIRAGRKWGLYPDHFGHVYSWASWPMKKSYWYLLERTDEAHLGLKHGHQRYLGAPVKYVWPLSPVTKAQFEKEYPVNGPT